MTLYLDTNASTPLDPRVKAALLRSFDESYGNSASTHEFGQRAKLLVQHARDQIAAVVDARRHEVIFTSGATESNNLALLGLMPHALQSGRRHVVSTQIEHKAILEPLDAMCAGDVEVTLVPPDRAGRVAPDEVLRAVRPDTLLVSVMQVNNETGVCQPIDAIAAGLAPPDVLLHVDAAQGFGKQLTPLRHERIDLISVSGHKIHAPQGIGALVVRRRAGGELPPLAPLMHGGGQELGLRPGTLPVPLIAALGLAAELAAQETDARAEHCGQLRVQVLAALAPLQPVVHGAAADVLPHVLNISLPGFDADHVIDLLAGIAAVSNGSACTSVCATASHVLTAMGVPHDELESSLRFSWSYLTPPDALAAALRQLVARLLQARAEAGNMRDAAQVSNHPRRAGNGPF